MIMRLMRVGAVFPRFLSIFIMVQKMRLLIAGSPMSHWMLFVTSWISLECFFPSTTLRLGLNYAPWGIRLNPIYAGLSMLTLVLVGVGVYRGFRS